jgi:hypothetical protein
MALSATITVECQIKGQVFTPYHYTITAGAHGAGGSCDIFTSIEALKKAGVNLISLAEDAPESLPVDIYVTIDQDRNHLFGGEYVKATWDYDAAAVHVHCRDWTGVLMDEKRVLTKGSGVETQNQSLSQIVTSIAKEYGLTPVLHLQSGGSDSGSTIQGTQFGSTDRTYMPRAQTAWATLTQLAKANGYEVHTTPDKELVFGEPGAGLPTLILAYQVTPPLPSGNFAIKQLRVEHNPRRNKSFKVLVQSYDPSTAKITKGTSTVIGTNLASGDETVNSGQWSSTDAASINSSLSSAKKKIPTYTFRVDGLTADQAQARADAIATDIAKRELIVSGENDGIPGIQLMQKMSLTGPTIETEFAAHTYWVNSFTHEMSMAGGRGHVGEFKTTLKALDIQEMGTGQAVSKGRGRSGRGSTASQVRP